MLYRFVKDNRTMDRHPGRQRRERIMDWPAFAVLNRCNSDQDVELVRALTGHLKGEARRKALWDVLHWADGTGRDSEGNLIPKPATARLWRFRDEDRAHCARYDAQQAGDRPFAVFPMARGGWGFWTP